MVTLPNELAAQIERFRESRSLPSESDALRRLIEIGLGSIDTPDDLTTRCAEATMAGNSVNYVIANILEDHPLVNTINISNDQVDIFLRNGEEIAYKKATRQWFLNQHEIPF